MILVVGLGAGGHAKVVIDILRACGACELVGLLDPRDDLQGTKVLGVPVLGDDDMLVELAGQGIGHFFVGLGTTGDVGPRRRLYDMAVGLGMHAVDAIHPSAVVSPSAAYGSGVTIAASAVVNACAVLGENVIVNTAAVVEHDCRIGDDVHIATGARLAGTVKVACGAYIGAGATIRECITIGQRAVVGAGAVVVKDVPANVTVVGVPAGPLKGATP